MREVGGGARLPPQKISLLFDRKMEHFAAVFKLDLIAASCRILATPTTARVLTNGAVLQSSSTPTRFFLQPYPCPFKFVSFYASATDSRVVKIFFGPSLQMVWSCVSDGFQ